MNAADRPGYLDLHPDPSFNFFMNRMVPPADADEVFEVGRGIKTVDDWVREMTVAAERADADGRIASAAEYWRAVDFYAPPGSPTQVGAYDRFMTLHDRAHPEVAALRTSVPFNGGHLPVIDVPPRGGNHGTIVMHSGFDGASEETYPSAEPLADAGYRVVLFDGPGQGNALRESGLHMTPDWEVPIGAVLDHLGIEDCTLVGVSLGGCLAPRAAAFESRVSRVVAWGAMYDFAGCFRRAMGDEMFSGLVALVEQGAREEINAGVGSAMSMDAHAKWSIEHGMHVSGASDPFDYFSWVLQMNLRDVSDRIRQDLLIIMGADDHLVPLAQAYEQAAAAKNARSVTLRITTAAEYAGQHCQVGNPRLVSDEIVRWLHGLRQRDQLVERGAPAASRAPAVSNPA